jgi:hypothetical protein
LDFSSLQIPRSKPATTKSNLNIRRPK